MGADINTVSATLMRMQAARMKLDKENKEKLTMTR